MVDCLGDDFDVKLLGTAACSPWSNEMCERLNAILVMNVRRIQEDAKCDVKKTQSVMFTQHYPGLWQHVALCIIFYFSGYSPK